MSISAKKSLGQNFLKSKEALRAIIDAGKLEASDVVLEIGPGKGVLTELLLQSAGKVIALEKDTRLIPLLSEKFATEIQNKRLEIIEQDILDLDPETLRPHASSYKIIANIPYYITGALLRKFLSATHQPKLMVLLVQKEVAERIVARDGKESILSMSVKAYGKPRYIKTVKAKYFSPQPKVDSAIILIDSISHTFFHDVDENFFFEVIKTGFAHKRKRLGGNLKSLFPNQNVDELLEKADVAKNARAEDVPLERWKTLLACVKAPEEELKHLS